MSFYSETLAQQTIKDIKRIIGNTPMRISYEIQDYGEFLLLIIDMIERPKQAQLEIWYRKLKEHFSDKFPKPKEGYSWMININYKGYILESVTDDISTL